jgi:hypothetical protein
MIDFVTFFIVAGGVLALGYIVNKFFREEC